MEAPVKVLSWQDIHDLIDELVPQVLCQNVQFISGVPRGGLIPAVLLSHACDIPFTSNTTFLQNETVLVVDDIVDSGRVMKAFRDTGYKTCCLHYKESAVMKPDIYAQITDENTWLVYPWEKLSAQKIQDYLKNS